MKIVINACHGGFSLSEAAVRRYCEIKGIKLWVVNGGKFKPLTGPNYFLVSPEEHIEESGDKWYKWSDEERREHNKKWREQTLYDREIARDDAALVQVVEELGDAANGWFAKLRVVEIPENVDWGISEYDGYEHVAERHRTWG